MKRRVWAGMTATLCSIAFWNSIKDSDRWNKDARKYVWCWLVGQSGSAMIHCLTDIIMALLFQRSLRWRFACLAFFVTNRESEPVLCIIFFGGILPFSVSQLRGWAIVAIRTVQIHLLTLDVMKCVGRDIGWLLAIQLPKTSRGSQIASMRGILRLLLPHDQPSEMLRRFAREFATTDSDIDRWGGATFF